MTGRAVKALYPFDFRSDFAPQPEPEPEPQVFEEPAEERISLTGPELAALLSEARAEGIAEARAANTREEAERLESVSGKLNEALAHLVALVDHLEEIAPNDPESARTVSLINAAAQRILDGQGDLFHTS